jgi:flagellar basal-body rod protein FlgF
MWVAFAMARIPDRPPHPTQPAVAGEHRPRPDPHMPVLNGLDSATSALRYWERKQEVVANNLANVSTDGFKAQRIFASLLDGMRPTAETSSDMTTGSVRQTGNDLDVAVNGPGFFVVSTPSGERYTRGGSLRLNDKHQLVDNDGRQLLGTKHNGPITLLDGPVDIDAQGNVKQGGQIVDTLRMESAPKGAELQHEGAALWIPPSTGKQDVPLADRAVKQGYIEESNVNSMSALIDMVAVQRSYSSVQKAIVTMDQANETVTTQLAKPL